MVFVYVCVGTPLWRLIKAFNEDLDLVNASRYGPQAAILTPGS